jgi:hypothetical protein
MARTTEIASAVTASSAVCQLFSSSSEMCEGMKLNASTKRLATTIIGRESRE